ncbi:MAG: VCBS repeat-containing protein, partial [Planctomycetes bacterium]|nr:VCBS repeat-containing protein [Planctomycetota bacterium]
MLRIRVAPAMLAVLSFAAFPLAARGSETRRGSEALAWPAVTRTCRPWTYWWWMGSAVTPEELTRHLEMYRAAGMGGCHIVPIYGAKGCEEKYIPFLSPEWMEVLAHTVAEARRLDMGIDMTTGTGWPFGGPNVGAQDAAARVLFERYEIAGGWRVESPIRSREQPKAALRALMAYPDAGDPIDLAAKVGAEGKLDWTAPPGRWRLIAVFQGWTEQQVKRAAPGGEGNVLDYFSRASLARYLERFDEAFAKYTGPPVRAFYNDSYEVYRANWTDDLFDAFTRRRGYDLRAHLPALLGDGPDDLVRRVRSDYRRTAGDLLLDAFTIPWVAWAHAKGSSARSQAHGSPANILDLYAACDIPETEAYGPNWIIASGGEVPPGIPPAFGGEADVLGCKFASSAAHVAGKPLVGCESCTWLSEHFRVSLAQAKAEIDLLFACGVNHVVFHGMTYSPREVSWPGWLFYAATNFGPSNTFWKDLPALNAYIARAQSFLQNGRPDADVLLYFPFSDLIAQDRGSANLLQYMQVHNTDSWFRRNLSTFHAAATRMWERGYLFDFVSDRQLDGMVAVEDGALRTPGGSYRALVIAGATILPPRTREAIDRLRGAGAKVLTAGVGDIETLLAEAGVPREPIADMGIRPIRRVHETGRDYFLANQGEERLEGWVPLGVPARAAVIFDPYHGTRGVARIRAESRRTEVYLQLDPGDAIVLRALERDVDGPPWPCFAAAGSAHEIRGAWTVEFIEGGPELPAPMRMEALESWAGDEPEGVHAGMNPAGIAIGDLDGDRIPDLAVANYGSEGISIFAGRAGGTFHAERRIAVGKSPMGLVAEDLDGDGDL